MQIVTLPAFQVVGLRIHTTALSSDIPKLWQQFMPYIDLIPSSTPGISYGLMGEMSAHNGDNTFTYMAALAVADDAVVDSMLDTWHVLAQRYAVFTAHMDTLGETFERIHGELIPAAGLQYGQGPSFEHYGPDFDETQTLQIHIAIQ
jgi:predicted transcriptional regulator YdeE